MSEKQDSNIPWWAIVLGFIFAWPLGLVLLFLNLGGVSIPIGQTRSGAQSGAKQQGRPSTAKASRGRTGRTNLLKRFGRPKTGVPMTIVGACTLFIFLMGLVDEWTTFGFYYVSDWFPLLGFTLAGAFLLGKGISRTRAAKRQRLYFGVIGQRNSVFLSDLAASAGVSEKRVVADLQDMLSTGVLPMGYIDRASGRLVLTDQGYEPPQPEPKKEEKPPAKEEGEDAVLREIRAVNDSIADEAMSRKIDRIEEITGKILEYQRQNPAKAAELRQFLSYYLPTTLKILRAYAQMEAQGVEGENISAAKYRIEGMMDKVVEGFEKQLDQLFQAQAMDITVDVEVLEQMLDRDGLGSGMTLGS